jgi:hypothetical protein
LSYRGWSVIKQRRRFGLGDLLLVCVLIAAIIGSIVGIAREEQHGIFEVSPLEEFERQAKAAHEADK